MFEFDGADGSIAQDNEGSFEVVAHLSSERQGSLYLVEDRISASSFYDACIRHNVVGQFVPRGDACFTRRRRFLRAFLGATKSWETTSLSKDVLAVAAHDCEVDIVLCRPIKRLYLRADNAKIRLLISAGVAVVDWPPIAATIYSEGGSSSVVLDRRAIAVSPAVICAVNGGSVCGFSPIGDRQANRIYTREGIVSFRTSRNEPSPFEAHLSYNTFKYSPQLAEWTQYNPDVGELADGRGGEAERSRRTVATNLAGRFHRSARPPGHGSSAPSHIFAIHGALHHAAAAAPWEQIGSVAETSEAGLFESFMEELTAHWAGEGGEFHGLSQALVQSLATPQPPTGRRAELEKKVERPVFVLAKKGASAAPTKEVPEADACVICKSAPKTHFSIGCAHLLYCDECVHRVVETNEWKACMICNAPSRGLSYKLF